MGVRAPLSSPIERMALLLLYKNFCLRSPHISPFCIRPCIPPHVYFDISTSLPLLCRILWVLFHSVAADFHALFCLIIAFNVSLLLFCARGYIDMARCVFAAFLFSFSFPFLGRIVKTKLTLRDELSPSPPALFITNVFPFSDSSPYH